MNSHRSSWFTESLSLLLEGQDLPHSLLMIALESITSAQADPVEVASFLTAFRMKGESAEEIAWAVELFRKDMVRINHPSLPVLDTCGTGGDHSGTFNISTATAFVVAGVNVPVVKHGNRSVSSKSGSADVLKELGVPIEAGSKWAQTCLEQIGFAFCFAPQFHPRFTDVAPLRRKLGFRTLFNLLGPLLNPAGAEYQLLGVSHSEVLDPMASALARLGIRKALVVCSRDGLDEISLSAPTMIRLVENQQVHSLEWSCTDFGLPMIPLENLKVDSVQQSAQMVLDVLEDRMIPAREIVIANAAAALFACETVANLHDGVLLATQSIHSGQARSVLERMKLSIP